MQRCVIGPDASRHSALLASAVANNIRWCAEVCATDPVTDRSDGVWVASAPVRPLFPDLITARPDVAADTVTGLLERRQTCSVKDSFADVNLAPYGFRVLFEARWIAGVPAAEVLAHTSLSSVGSAAELARWCRAAGLPAPLPVHLLMSHATSVLTYGAAGPAGGGIATRSGDVVGVSNVFGAPTVWPDLMATVSALFPGLPVVGYESAGLDTVLASGFDVLGPLRVWLR